jgi:hypothetical protein
VDTTASRPIYAEAQNAPSLLCCGAVWGTNERNA